MYVKWINIYTSVLAWERKIDACAKRDSVFVAIALSFNAANIADDSQSSASSKRARDCRCLASASCLSATNCWNSWLPTCNSNYFEEI